MHELIETCTKSYPSSISVSQCQEQVSLIAELLPDWLMILKVSSGVFVKIDKEKNLAELFDRLDKTVERLKS